MRWRGPRVNAPRSRWCASTSTTSPTSTRRSGTRRATRCCRRWQTGSPERCASTTRWRGSAATSSASSARWSATSVPRSRPCGGCWRRWTHRSCSRTGRWTSPPAWASPSSSTVAVTAGGRGLLRDADTAMHRAKERRGTTSTSSSTPRCACASSTVSSLEQDLLRALDEQQFVLHYQPLVSLAAAPDRGRRGARALAAPGGAGWYRRPTSSRSPRTPA